MSEQIYAWLLRLYPVHFRERYSEDVLRLFRDRMRDERGFFPRLRLWLDLLADFAVSLPREHSYVQPAQAFHLLESEAPRPGSLLLGGLLSLLIFSAFPAGMRQAAPQAGGRAPRIALGPSTTEHRQVVDAVIANLKQHYVNPAVGQKMADAVRAHESRGDYDAVTEGQSLADLLTTQIRDVSQDNHLEVVYSPTPLPNPSAGPTPGDQARYRKALEQSNCTFEKIEILPHNIGFLKLNSFPDLSICRPTAVAAMASLNQAGAIIFDLRDNRGGYPDMVAFIAAYLFDHPEYFYNPRENTTEQSWTHSPVPGNKLADKPVYLLTSRSTWSGAEQFTYNLKMLKRATLVGETTGGGAHAGVFHRIDDHFGIGIPEVKAINPFSKNDWEGTGVAPDVKVPAADALAAARKLAVTKLH